MNKDKNATTKSIRNTDEMGEFLRSINMPTSLSPRKRKRDSSVMTASQHMAPLSEDTPWYKQNVNELGMLLGIGAIGLVMLFAIAALM